MNLRGEEDSQITTNADLHRPHYTRGTNWWRDPGPVTQVALSLCTKIRQRKPHLLFTTVRYLTGPWKALLTNHRRTMGT